MKRSDDRPNPQVPLGVAVTIALGLFSGVGGAVGAAYAIRDQALAEMRQTVRVAIQDETGRRTEALEAKSEVWEARWVELTRRLDRIEARLRR